MSSSRGFVPPWRERLSDQHERDATPERSRTSRGGEGRRGAPSSKSKAKPDVMLASPSRGRRGRRRTDDSENRRRDWHDEADRSEKSRSREGRRRSSGGSWRERSRRRSEEDWHDKHSTERRQEFSRKRSQSRRRKRRSHSESRAVGDDDAAWQKGDSSKAARISPAPCAQAKPEIVKVELHPTSPMAMVMLSEEKAVPALLASLDGDQIANAKVQRTQIKDDDRSSFYVLWEKDIVIEEAALREHLQSKLEGSDKVDRTVSPAKEEGTILPLPLSLYRKMVDDDRSAFQSIMLRSCAKIDVREDEPMCRVHVVGSEEQVELARNLIQTACLRYAAWTDEVEVKVLRNSSVLNKLERLERVSHAKILLSHSADEDYQTLSIQGSAKSVAHARYLVVRAAMEDGLSEGDYEEREEEDEELDEEVDAEPDAEAAEYTNSKKSDDGRALKSKAADADDADESYSYSYDDDDEEEGAEKNKSAGPDQPPGNWRPPASQSRIFGNALVAAGAALPRTHGRARPTLAPETPHSQSNSALSPDPKEQEMPHASMASTSQLQVAMVALAPPPPPPPPAPPPPPQSAAPLAANQGSPWAGALPASSHCPIVGSHSPSPELGEQAPSKLAASQAQPDHLPAPPPPPPFPPPVPPVVPAAAPVALKTVPPKTVPPKMFTGSSTAPLVAVPPLACLGSHSPQVVDTSFCSESREASQAVPVSVPPPPPPLPPAAGAPVHVPPRPGFSPAPPLAAVSPPMGQRCPQPVPVPPRIPLSQPDLKEQALAQETTHKPLQQDSIFSTPPAPPLIAPTVPTLPRTSPEEVQAALEVARQQEIAKWKASNSSHEKPAVVASAPLSSPPSNFTSQHSPMYSASNAVLADAEALHTVQGTLNHHRERDTWDSWDTEPEPTEKLPDPDASAQILQSTCTKAGGPAIPDGSQRMHFDQMNCMVPPPRPPPPKVRPPTKMLVQLSPGNQGNLQPVPPAGLPPSQQSPKMLPVGPVLLDAPLQASPAMVVPPRPKQEAAFSKGSKSWA
eukprot:TRINITY_DN29497_c0_g1_i1.p1 TRINITY_DN29497_c0_g1~~TRINITY_DN29497_c0_g1_i1.p1  ORF type:complete len:1023 (+),score=167.53 TRINITY_DN29497_c0_g1_i1:136-3204(+)